MSMVEYNKREMSSVNGSNYVAPQNMSGQRGLIRQLTANTEDDSTPRRTRIMARGEAAHLT